jgi:hypothetical protein
MNSLEESDNCSLIKTLSQHLPGGTEENHKNLLGQPVPWLRFESICLEGLRKTIKTCWYNQCPGSDLNRAPTMLPLYQSVMFLVLDFKEDV